MLTNLPAYLIEQNRTKIQSNSIEDRIVRLSSVIEQNRTSILLSVRLSNQSNKIECNQTQSDAILFGSIS